MNNAEPWCPAALTTEGGREWEQEGEVCVGGEGKYRREKSMEGGGGGRKNGAGVDLIK